MKRSKLVVFANATEGSDTEFNQWYDEIHLGEVLAIPGFVGAERLELSDVQVAPEDRPHRYLAIYEIEGDPQAALDALLAASSTMNMSITLSDDAATSLYTQITPRVTAKA